jgi:hypothetical protein
LEQARDDVRVLRRFLESPTPGIVVHGRGASVSISGHSAIAGLEELRAIIAAGRLPDGFQTTRTTRGLLPRRMVEEIVESLD